MNSEYYALQQQQGMVFQPSQELPQGFAPVTQQSAPVSTAHSPIPPAPSAPPVVQQVSNQPTTQCGTAILTPQQVEQLVAQLKPTVMSNPVKITQPSYLVTEEQMRYILSLAQGNPIQLPQLQRQFYSNNQEPPSTQRVQPTVVNGGSLFDGVANATLGTIGRVGHTFTGLIDSVVDIFTLGYARK